MNIKQGSYVELNTILLESNQVEGDIYPLVYVEESTVHIKESNIRTMNDENIHCINFLNSSVSIQDTDLNVQTVFKDSKFELLNIALEVIDNNGLYVYDNSEGSIKDSNLFAGSIEKNRSTIELLQSKLTIINTDVFLNNQEKYLNACFIKESTLFIESVFMTSIKSVTSTINITDFLYLVELGDFEDNSTVTGDSLLVTGGNHNKVNVYANNHSSIQLLGIAVGRKINPDIKLERNVEFNVQSLRLFQYDYDKGDFFINENNQYVLLDKSIDIVYFGEKTAFEKLEEMIGLKKAKAEVKEFIAIAQMNKLRKEQGLDNSSLTLHSLFLL